MTDAVAPVRFRQGSGRLCLDYLRTLRYRDTDQAAEELDSPQALAAWVRQCGPVGDLGTPPPGDNVLSAARDLREAVHGLVVAALGPHGPSALKAADRDRLNRVAAGTVPSPRIGADGLLDWYADEPVTATLALIARDALDLATSPALLGRLRPCASPTCGALFLDHSRPGTRRWCSMEVCGNRAKKSRRR